MLLERDPLARRCEAMLGDDLVSQDDLELRSGREVLDAHVHHAADRPGRHAVSRAGQAHMTIGLHLADQELTRVEAWDGGRRPERLDLVGVPIDRSLPGGAVNPDVRHALNPSIELRVQVGQGGEGPAGEERALEVLHARLDLALRPRPVRRAGDGQAAVMLAEVKESAVEPDLLAKRVAIDGGLHVVDQQLLRNAQPLERLPETREQHRLLHAGREPSEEHPRETQHEHEGVELLSLSIDVDRSALAPVELRLPARQGLEPFDDLPDLLALTRVHELLQDGDAALVSELFDLAQQHRSWQLELTEAIVDERLEWVQLRPPRNPLFSGSCLQDVVDRLA